MEAQWGGLTRIEYVFFDEIVDFGAANESLQWLGGIQLKTGVSWKRFNSTVYGHAFRNDFGEGVYSRVVELGDVSDSNSTDYALHQSVNRHFVVKGVGQNGQQWLIASPNAPMTLSMTVVRTIGAVTMWKGTLTTETKEPLYRWSDAHSNIRVRYSETPIVPSNGVFTPIGTVTPQGTTVTTISALPVGGGRWTLNANTNALLTEAQRLTLETARLAAAETARLAAAAQATAHQQADAALITAQQYAAQTSAQRIAAEAARLQAESDARAAAEAARLSAEAARQIALADALRANATAAEAFRVTTAQALADAHTQAESARLQVAQAIASANAQAEAARLQTASQYQALLSAYTQGLAAQAQANAQLVATLVAAQPKPYASSAAAGAFLLTEPVVNQPVTPTEPVVPYVPYVPYTSQTDDTG